MSVYTGDSAKCPSVPEKEVHFCRSLPVSQSCSVTKRFPVRSMHTPVPDTPIKYPSDAASTTRNSAPYPSRQSRIHSCRSLSQSLDSHPYSCRESSLKLTSRHRAHAKQ